MGLKERRAITSFQESTYPPLHDAIQSAAGFEVPMEVDWSSLAIDGSDHLYEDCIPKVYFTPLSDAIAAICADDMGKEALQEALKKVVVKNDAGNSSPSNCFDFTDGVLTVDHKPTTNVDNIVDRTKALTSLLENSL